MLKLLFRKRKIIVGIAGLLLLYIVGNSVYGMKMPLPEGMNMTGEMRQTQVEFLTDLTYQKGNERKHEQNIFARVIQLINTADDFIVMDMFLFNDSGNGDGKYQHLSDDIASHLIARKQELPEMPVIVITDRINTTYGNRENKTLEMLKDNGISVVLTDLKKLPDSNSVYSGFWRGCIAPLGIQGKGWLPDPFDKRYPKATLRAYGDLFNFKANHRKVLITEDAAIVASANPHDGSSLHSNIAFQLRGVIQQDLLLSEQSVADFSGHPFTIPDFQVPVLDKNTDDVQVLTEKSIGEKLVEEVQKTVSGDNIDIGVFYLADKELLQELINASNRGVNIRLVLDVNRDAFGHKKIGIPNRPMASWLLKQSGGKINIRWYETQGEQFHSKIAIFRKPDAYIVIGGSANFTRRNLRGYNLETSVRIVSIPESRLAQTVDSWFERIWSNPNNEVYTVDYSVHADEAYVKYIISRIQEASGLSSF